MAGFAGQDAHDILDRLKLLGVPCNDLDAASLLETKIYDPVRTTLCELAAKIADSSASAKLTVKSLEAAPAESKQLEDALRQYEKAVCGPGWQVDGTRAPWQFSLQRLTGHLQAKAVLERRLASTAIKTSTAQGSGTDQGNAACSAKLEEIAELIDCDSVQTVEEQLKAVRSSLMQMLQILPEDVSKSLVNKTHFSEEQLDALTAIFDFLAADYKTRRLMLIERAKVTLQAMLWSTDWLEQQGTIEEARKVAEEGEATLNEAPSVTFEEVFQASLGDIISVTNRAVNLEKDKVRATVKDVLIGDVPDRGGRPLEGRAAAAQGVMPAWAPRSSTSGSQNHGGGGRGRGCRTQSGAGRRGRGKGRF